MTTTTATSPKLNPAECQALFDRADAAGQAAGDAVVPRVMVVTAHEDPMDDSSPVVYREVVSEGACGFAWVNVRPGNSRMARWLVASDHAHKDSYYGGVSVWVRGFQQSVERKYAYARAFAEVLTEAGISAHASSRLD